MPVRIARNVPGIRGFPPWHRLAGALLLALVFGCAQLPTRPALGVSPETVSVPQPSSSTGFSAAYAKESARIEAFELIWKTIGEKFYDASMNGVDWQAVHDRYRPQVEKAASDAELYRVWNAMARELKDSHTSVLTPRQSVERRSFRFTRNTSRRSSASRLSRSVVFFRSSRSRFAISWSRTFPRIALGFWRSTATGSNSPKTPPTARCRR